MKKVLIVLAAGIFLVGIVTIGYARTLYHPAPNLNSSIGLVDGNSTQYEWEIWIDRTNSRVMFSSCRGNGGWPCPSEAGDGGTPSFDETKGTSIGGI